VVVGIEDFDLGVSIEGDRGSLADLRASFHELGVQRTNLADPNKQIPGHGLVAMVWAWGRLGLQRLES
jgi:hypothetical protein